MNPDISSSRSKLDNDTTSPPKKHSLKFYVTITLMVILTVVVVSEVVISHRSGVSINMDVFGRVLDVITSVLTLG